MAVNLFSNNSIFLSLLSFAFSIALATTVEVEGCFFWGFEMSAFVEEAGIRVERAMGAAGEGCLGLYWDFFRGE